MIKYTFALNLVYSKPLMDKKVNIAIFASGGGSNAEKILQHFESSPHIEVKLIVSNSKEAGVLNHAVNFRIASYVHNIEDVSNGNLLAQLVKNEIHFIVLAGYLKKIGDDLIQHFQNKIVNVHPALLPKFGGKGMFGMNVHRAVVAAGEKVSGPTIHFVNENYDEGAIIEQHSCRVLPTDSAEDVQKKVLELEHKYFAPCIQKVIENGI